MFWRLEFESKQKTRLTLRIECLSCVLMFTEITWSLDVEMDRFKFGGWIEHGCLFVASHLICCSKEEGTKTGQLMGHNSGVTDIRIFLK